MKQWGQSPAAPPLGRVIATVSLIVWVGVIVTGRMIGFTATRAAAGESAPVDTNFEDLLGLPAPSDAPAPAPQ